MTIRPRMFVLIDALRWEYLKDREFLSDICPYRTPLRTVLGFSSGAIPSILTGTLPQSHGHWNLFYYDPEGSPLRWVRAFTFLPDRLLDNRITRKLIKEIGRRIQRLGTMFECYVPVRLLPYFNISERRNIYQPRGLNGTNSIFDRLTTRNIPFRTYSYHHHTDAEILTLAEKDLRAKKQSFYFLYLSEMDAFLHQHCQDSARVERKMEWYATRLRRLYAVAKESFPDILFSVFSDHGMTPNRGHSDVVGEVEELGFAVPRDYLAVYDSTMARFWFFRPEARKAVTERLARLDCGCVLEKEELQALGLNFPDRRYGEVIFLMNPGVLLARNNFNGQWLPAGMHGYHPDDCWSDAAFLSSEAPPTPLKTITELFNLMTHGIN